MLFFYNFLLALYHLVIRIFSLFNEKAKRWIDGRKNWQQHIGNTLQKGERRIWIHCSSLGEFEQARPVIEALKNQYPTYKTVATFFSPSGYEACKKNNLPDYIFYLPHDTHRNAQEFIALTEPVLAVFIKYEFWYHFLTRLNAKQIPVILVSGAFRQGQPFFKWYGGLFRKMLHSFSYFFLQDEISRQMLQSIGIDKNVVISGDTRFDRVTAIASDVKPIPFIDAFKDNSKLLIAGSTWPGDEAILRDCLSSLPDDWKLVIAPHEIDDAHIRKIRQLFDNQPVLYSELLGGSNANGKRILIIDNIGMLSRLFAYGDIAFIGGGFQKGGIHNTLEPAVFGLPVIMGPVYHKFVEAKRLVQQGFAFPVNDATEAISVLDRLINDNNSRKELNRSIRTFMQQNTGATSTIMDRIRAEKWLN
mgnify:CR=1 FL=1